MAETPIATDPNVLQKLYQRFDYLQDLPSELRGCLIDDATNLGTLEADSFLGFLMAYTVEAEVPTKDHFAFLSVEQNLKINRYRHIRPVEPWPQPIIGVSFGTDATGRTTGNHQVDVMMRNVGNAQLWFGGEVGVIWEAFFEPHIQSSTAHEELMHQLWNYLEVYLKDLGVKLVFTYNRDPALDEPWYRGFLANRGYKSLAATRAVMKSLG